MGHEGWNTGVGAPGQRGEVAGAAGQRPLGAANDRRPGSSGERRAPARPLTIGVLTPFIDGFYFGALLNGIHQTAQQRGHRMMVMRATPAEVEAPSLARDLVDGWIVILNTKGIEAIDVARTPLVTVGANVPEGTCPAVMPDNHHGTRSAARHLIEHGHRRIAFAGYREHDDVRGRFEAYRQTLAEADIPFDPELVFETDNNLIDGGEAAAKRFLARRPACTAMVVATDKNAIGLMRTLQAAGIRVPDDLAITGFDDIIEAQCTDPPLTTVRQRFDLQGKMACEILLAQLAGEAVPRGSVVAPTAFIQRSSCGCKLVQRLLYRTEAALGGEAGEPATRRGGVDREVLARQMVELLLAPHALPPDTPPTAVWPGVTLVIDAWEAALEGAPPPAASAVHQAFRQARQVTLDLEALLGTVRLLSRCSRRRLAAAGGAAEERVEDFLESARVSIARARLDSETESLEQLRRLVKSNHDVGLALLNGVQHDGRWLSWIETTEVRWGCVALWDDPSTRTHLVVTGAYSRDGDATPAIGSRWPREAFPSAELLPPSTAGGPFIVTVLPVRSPQRDWGVLVVVGPTSLEVAGHEGTVAIWGTLLSAALERDALMRSLTTQHADLQGAYERERSLSQTVRELGCPILPLSPDVLLVPLIGAIDGDRASQVLEEVVEGVSRHAARCVLLDLTGVAFVDAQVAASLGVTSRAAAMLGARVYLVGVRPEIAMRLIELRVELGDLKTYASLSAALQELAPTSRRAE